MLFSSFFGSEMHGFEVLADGLVDPRLLCLQGLLEVGFIDVFVGLLSQVFNIEVQAFLLLLKGSLGN